MFTSHLRQVQQKFGISTDLMGSSDPESLDLSDEVRLLVTMVTVIIVVVSMVTSCCHKRYRARASRSSVRRIYTYDNYKLNENE